MRSLGQALRERRVQLGLSQEALAEAVGVSPRSVTRWEQGRAVPHPDYRRRLARLIGLDPGARRAWTGPAAAGTDRARRDRQDATGARVRLPLRRALSGRLLAGGRQPRGVLGRLQRARPCARPAGAARSGSRPQPGRGQGVVPPRGRLAAPPPRAAASSISLVRQPRRHSGRRPGCKTARSPRSSGTPPRRAPGMRSSCGPPTLTAGGPNARPRPLD